MIAATMSRTSRAFTGSTCQRSRSRSELCTMHRREVHHAARRPRALPASQVEEPVEQRRGEAPDDEARGPGIPHPGDPDGCSDGHPVGRVEELGDRHDDAPTPSRPGSTARTGLGSRHQPEHRRHDEVARRQPEGRELAEHVDACRVEAGLLLRLAQRGRRPRRRPRDPAHPPGNATCPACERMSCDALGQQHLWPFGALRRTGSAPTPAAPSRPRAGVNSARHGGAVRLTVDAPARATRAARGTTRDAHHACPPRSSSMPRCSSSSSASSPRSSIGPAMRVDDLAVGIDEHGDGSPWTLRSGFGQHRPGRTASG